MLATSQIILHNSLSVVFKLFYFINNISVIVKDQEVRWMLKHLQYFTFTSCVWICLILLNIFFIYVHLISMFFWSYLLPNLLKLWKCYAIYKVCYMLVITGVVQFVFNSEWLALLKCKDVICSLMLMMMLFKDVPNYSWIYA